MPKRNQNGSLINWKYWCFVIWPTTAEQSRMKEIFGQYDNLPYNMINVTRFGEISLLWQKFTGLLQFFEGFFLIWQNDEPTLANLWHYWANFHCCKWPKFEKEYNHLLALNFIDQPSLILKWLSICQFVICHWWPNDEVLKISPKVMEWRLLRRPETSQMWFCNSLTSDLGNVCCVINSFWVNELEFNHEIANYSSTTLVI